MKNYLFLLIIIFPYFISAQNYSVSDHELFFMPTAYTMPAKSSYFTDYELVVINYVYAPTSRTHLGLISLFPITTDFVESITFGIKQNVIKGEKLNMAFWGTYSPKISGFSIGSVYSFGKMDKSFHVGIGVNGDDEMDNTDFAIMFGGHLRVSPRMAFMIEYQNLQSGIENDFKGMITIGARFKGKGVSFDFGGFRPLQNTGSFLFFPFLKGTFLFK